MELFEIIVPSSLHVESVSGGNIVMKDDGCKRGTLKFLLVFTDRVH